MPVKPTLLAIELWGLGDLVLAVPFLRAACEKFQVTLLAKPFAAEVLHRFCPDVQLVSAVVPWTAFRGKYRVWAWPWAELVKVLRPLRGRFDLAVSARWDPRDHFLQWLLGVPRRIGFPRIGSGLFLTDRMPHPGRTAHRYEYWRVLGAHLDLVLPALREFVPGRAPAGARTVLVHTGAARPVRVWPLDRFAAVVGMLRGAGWRVIVACDPDQLAWWRASGEPDAVVPASIGELLALCEQCSVFVGNDSGPGHLAALCGVPTFTIFGPQLPEMFSPLHPQAKWIPGRPCPYKPCFDYCRFCRPRCIESIPVEEVWEKLRLFLAEAGQ